MGERERERAGTCPAGHGARLPLPHAPRKHGEGGNECTSARARGCERGERGEGYLSRSIDEGVSLSLPFSRRQARARAEVEWSGWWMYDFSARERGE